MHCGNANPNGNIELFYKGGCKKELDIKEAYRCTGCGGWFHKKCIFEHFKLEKDHDFGRNEERKRLIGIVDEVRGHYDKGIFRAITSEELDKIHLTLKKDFGISIDRLSAFYARWMCDVIKKHFDEYSK